MTMLENDVKALIRDVADFPKPGILFKDITPVFFDAKLCQRIIDFFADEARKNNIEAVCGVESRGFLFGPSIALQLGVPFVPIRKKGKLPGDTISYSYDLEYGSATVEMHTNVLKKEMKVLIHDDLLATGGTAAAGAELVKMQGAQVAGFSFLVDLSFLGGKRNLQHYTKNIVSICNY
jgi:adenine phosphoribosyltransferase